MGASDYARIGRENRAEYGNIERWGRNVLADRYDYRTHFVYELLQNAEDALRRRSARAGSGRVRFALENGAVRFSHFGQPFTYDDVRGVCGIDLSTKDEYTEIGRFGMGFKAVYAITDCPRIHSGDEHFAINDYAFPEATSKIDQQHGETTIVLPLKAEVGAAEVASAFERLGARTLLFLREIGEIEWSGGNGSSGLYRRDERRTAAESESVRRLTLHGEAPGEGETWLVFSQDVRSPGGKPAGRVELAFRLSVDGSGKESIRAIGGQPLFVFFPTVFGTNLGMLVQGPYRTTSNRDNIKQDDDWNRHLIGETAHLLVEALRHLRDHDLLNPCVFDALPLDRARFAGGFFAPLFDAVHTAVASERLLPAHSRGGSRSHIPASQAWLARDAGIRNLISRRQLDELVVARQPAGWLTRDITAGRTPALYRYLKDEHDVGEIGLLDLLRFLRSRPRFLPDQPDFWIRRLYGFLHQQNPGRWSLADVPLIRLEDGSHIAPGHGRTDAYLPTDPPSGFPNTVRREVCSSGPALEFLKWLGLSEPDRVDDLIRNVIPKYRDQPSVRMREYGHDLRSMIAAHRDASQEQRRRLTEALRGCAFVRAADAATGELSFVRPDMAYLGSQRLRELFEGVPSVLLTASPPQGVSRADMTNLLTACGVSQTLVPVLTQEDVEWRSTPSLFSHEELREMRIREQGQDNITRIRGSFLIDSRFRGLNELISYMQGLAPDAASRKARLLWEALCAVQDAEAFEGSYVWYYYQRKTHVFPSASVRLLNEAAWVPDESGVLQSPRHVLFDSLGWQANHLAQSRIEFLPPARDALAKEAGYDKEDLDLLDQLKAQGISHEEARARLGLAGPSAPQEPFIDDDDGNAPLDALREGEQPHRDADEAITATGSARDVRSGDSSGGSGASGGSSGSTGSSHDVVRQAVRGAGGGSGGSGASGGSSGNGGGTRTLESYIAVRAESEREPDPDAYERRMETEGAAIARIVEDEPALRRTQSGNEGFDLYEVNDAGETVRWVEVKSMSGGWESSPVAMSHTQFGMAREKGDAYWLYVVERAGTDDPNVVRIQDPAGRASTYTFDEGWREAPQA